MELQAWQTKTVAETARDLNTDLSKGLSGEEVAARRQEYGLNVLRQTAKKSPFLLFLGQFNDFMVWVLIAAALVSGIVIREVIDGLAILVILVLNAILGFVQEYRAEEALDALKKLAAPRSRVIRGGREAQVPSEELVPGDIILLESGDIVPADARLAEARTLLVNEAAITGESEAVAKTVATLSNPTLPPADRTNLAYMGTTIFTGRAKAIVTETGTRTEMGKIAELIQVQEEKTPLQIELHSIGRMLALIVLTIAAIVFAAGLARGFDLIFMFLASVSLAVAAIPEGLPAIVTITLAIGVQAMAAHNAIVRKLSAVETLGSTTVICTDKTGTLTLNRMTAEKLFIDGHVFDLADFRLMQEEALVNADDLSRLLEIAALCNDARLTPDGTIVGDPTEIALLRLSEHLNFAKSALEARHPRIDEAPFDSERKRMTTINKDDGSALVLTKGAPEMVLPLCTHELLDGSVRQLPPGRAQEILTINNRLAAEGYRDLAFAFKQLTTIPAAATEQESNLVFTGLVALTDPPRPEVPQAIATAGQARMRVVMVTGDHKLTATAIAERIGLLAGRRVLTGAELEKMSTEELAKIIYQIGVFSRVDPVHKVKIVDAFKTRGEVVAMTGDGVNDAPAVKRADIGISMGKTGTEVTKEASDIVLADDNFATIVRAVREGRLIFDNLKKFVLYLLSCNTSEVLTVFLALMAGLPVPLLPPQILLTNLITDGLPALALGVEPPAPDLMGRPPRNIKEGILARPRLVRVVWQGFVLTAAILGAFIATLIATGTPLFSAGRTANPASLALAQTVAFTTMVAIQLLHSLNYRSPTATIFSRESFKNRFLILAIVGSFLLQLALIYLPFLQELFNTKALGLREWIIVGVAIVPALVVIDLSKLRNFVGRF